MDIHIRSKRITGMRIQGNTVEEEELLTKAKKNLVRVVKST